VSRAFFFRGTSVPMIRSVVMEQKTDGHVELTKTEARQSTARPPTQYVLGFSLVAVILAFVIIAIYWAI
jgi:hypothetical protein